MDSSSNQKRDLNILLQIIKNDIVSLVYSCNINLKISITSILRNYIGNINNQQVKSFLENTKLFIACQNTTNAKTLQTINGKINKSNKYIDKKKLYEQILMSNVDNKLTFFSKPTVIVIDHPFYSTVYDFLIYKLFILALRNYKNIKLVINDNTNIIDNVVATDLENNKLTDLKYGLLRINNADKSAKNILGDNSMESVIKKVKELDSKLDKFNIVIFVLDYFQINEYKNNLDLDKYSTTFFSKNIDKDITKIYDKIMTFDKNIIYVTTDQLELVNFKVDYIFFNTIFYHSDISLDNTNNEEISNLNLSIKKSSLCKQNTQTYINKTDKDDEKILYTYNFINPEEIILTMLDYYFNIAIVKYVLSFISDNLFEDIITRLTNYSLIKDSSLVTKKGEFVLANKETFRNLALFGGSLVYDWIQNEAPFSVALIILSMIRNFKITNRSNNVFDLQLQKKSSSNDIIEYKRRQYSSFSGKDSVEIFLMIWKKMINEVEYIKLNEKDKEESKANLFCPFNINENISLYSSISGNKLKKVEKWSQNNKLNPNYIIDIINDFKYMAILIGKSHRLLIGDFKIENVLSMMKKIINSNFETYNKILKLNNGIYQDNSGEFYVINSDPKENMSYFVNKPKLIYPIQITKSKIKISETKNLNIINLYLDMTENQTILTTDEARKKALELLK